ncbi:MAG: aminotransferase class III-fold pyridoxal phosphate-dependent enzyme [Spirochaetaceae bacterium]|nr:MAG: aminotransferase class III-fold pyridoxal phosphate-dependent enzyme [Spirochaetaceae bacterium]
MSFPGQKSSVLIQELLSHVVVDPYPFVVDLRRCSGMQIATIDGDLITDWGGLYGSKLIGYNHPKLFTEEYLTRLAYASATKLPNPDFLTPECLEYYRTVKSIAPRCMHNERLEVYAVNSGAEAVENMMKYFINRHQRTSRAKGINVPVSRFLYFDQAFHGRTVFALNITRLDHDPVITRNYEGFVPGNLKVPFPAWNNSRSDSDNDRELDSCLATIEQLFQTYGHEIAGVILEPIQGAGGHRIAAPRFFTRLSELCHTYDINWGLDEVQTAGGQCGSVFSIDLYDIPYPPQAVASAKKFGNGVVFMVEPMDDVGVLDSTWGGTLSDMVRFVEEWNIVRDEQLLEQVPEKTGVLVSGLKSLETRWPGKIENVRGLGLYQGFSFRTPSDSGVFIDRALEDEALLMLGAGPGTIRLRPPLDVTHNDIEDMIARAHRILDRMYGNSAPEGAD